jgi:hypothetical protein
MGFGTQRVTAKRRALMARSTKPQWVILLFRLPSSLGRTDYQYVNQRVKHQLVLRRSAKRWNCHRPPTICSMRRLLVLLLVLACVIQAVYAAPTGSDALSQFAKCAGMTSAAERLKCYDATADRAGFGLPPERQPATRSDDFGKPPPPARPPEVQEISASVVEFSRTLRGRALFALDNGQTWGQLDADGTRVDDPRPGENMKVKIERGWLDSYNLTIDGRHPSIKVRRVK